MNISLEFAVAVLGGIGTIVGVYVKLTNDITKLRSELRSIQQLTDQKNTFTDNTILKVETKVDALSFAMDSIKSMLYEIKSSIHKNDA